MGKGRGARGVARQAARARGLLLAAAAWQCGEPDRDVASVASAAGAAEASPLDAGAVLPADAGAVLPADAGPFGFRRDVYPVFVAYCGECHRVNGPYHDIGSPDLARAYADSVEYAERIVIRIRQGNMPPGCVFDTSACVPAEAVASIERWIDEGLPE
jgi:hypothetical protein